MDNSEDNLINHLEELRKILLQCVIALAIVLPFTFFISPKVLNFLIKIIVTNKDIVLNYFSPAEVFLIQIKTAFVLDLAICFPFISKKLWDFILPALYENERKFIKSIVALSSFLFVSGVIFCLFFILPLIINFGMSFSTSDIKAVFGISNVINLSLWLSIAFGIMFQFPIIVHSLIKSGIVDKSTIINARPYVIVVILILAGILTPPDIVSQIMLFLPTYALFELGLLFSR